MDCNIKKYNTLVTKMNKMVKDAKEKCYWDPKIMKMCKKWDKTIKNTVMIKLSMELLVMIKLV
ncbi:hypothetical protein Hanom_Chr02g00135101 [Helianthus anomalus]